MRKRGFRSLFGGRGQCKLKAKEEEAAVSIPGVAKLLGAEETKRKDPNLEADEENEEIREDDEEWGEDIPEENSTTIGGTLEHDRDRPRICDSYSISSMPTSVSSKALRHVKTFDYSEASSFSLASRRSTDLYDPNDAQSILTGRIPPTLLRLRRPSKIGGDAYSVANSSVTTSGSTSVLFSTATFDLSGASMFGTAREESENSSVCMEGSSEECPEHLPSQDTGMANTFSRDVHSFFDRVFNTKIVEGDEE